jgi:hypothetical protein
MIPTRDGVGVSGGVDLGLAEVRWRRGIEEGRGTLKAALLGLGAWLGWPFRDLLGGGFEGFSSDTKGLLRSALELPSAVLLIAGALVVRAERLSDMT